MKKIILTFLFAFTTLNCSLAIEFNDKTFEATEENITETSEEEKQNSLLDMLFGAFSKQQDEGDDPQNIHLEDALRSEPDKLEPGTITNIVENLEGDFQNTSKFTIINTRTGRVHKASIKVGEVYEFEKIAIKNLSCWSKFETTILPEARSLAEIYNIAKNPKISKIFHGWLISSSQNSSLLENKEYDVILNSCSNK